MTGFCHHHHHHAQLMLLAMEQHGGMIVQVQYSIDIDHDEYS